MTTAAAVDDYAAYLESAHWHEVRRRCLWRWDYRCAVCHSAQFVDVHHRTYKRLGRERDTDVIALCRKCHTLFHEHRVLAGGG